jgi:hypothetical protein
MPAGSELPPLPHTFRPVGVRVAASVLGGLLVLVTLVIWFAFPQNVRDQFTWFQRGTVVFFGLAAMIAGHALARSRVDARADGLTVVNGYKTRRYDWTEVLAVTLRAGSPWALLDLADGTSVSAMGIQGSDGARAITQVKQLRSLVEEHSRTERDD